MRYQWTLGLDPLGEAMKIRTEVFVLEQNVLIELEQDHWDEKAWQLLAYEGKAAVGTLRLFADETGQWCLGRMAVLASYRGQGYGRILVEEALRQAHRLHVPSLLLHAQVQAQGFYQRLGFVGFGEIFEEAGIPHQLMCQELTETTVRENP